jgi:hypothetical protein
MVTVLLNRPGDYACSEQDDRADRDIHLSAE